MLFATFMVATSANLTMVQASALARPDFLSVMKIEPAQSSAAKKLKIAKLQVLLDRAGISPGVINGLRSEHLTKAIELYQSSGTAIDILKNEQVLDQKLMASGGDAFVDYILSEADVSGPYARVIPTRIQDQDDLKRLSYRSPSEQLAERFHMDEQFLLRLNKGADFSKPGTIIKVANIGRSLDRRVTKIKADKTHGHITAYDEKGSIVAFYPASIGSKQNPSPSGNFTVRNKAGFPAYTLSPENGFEKIDDGVQRVIAPGPNNPVGTAWIGLSERGYGIHGTPEPSKIGSEPSHGCIRLTNWDAMELTVLVKPGVEVIIQ